MSRHHSGLKGFAFVLALVLSLIGAAPAYAITGGQPDNGGHPQVALLYSEYVDADGIERASICSGTLIAPEVILTAGHCTYSYDSLGVSKVDVTFDDYASGDSTFYTSRKWETYSAYDSYAWPYTVDVGLVFLQGRGATGVPTARLAETGKLDALIPDPGASDYVFTTVGYGQTGVDTSGSGRPTANFPLQRRYAEQTYSPGGYDSLLLELKANPSDQHGSGCGGDSGGPVFLDDQNTIVAVHTGGYNLGVDGSICGRVASLNHRVDTDTVLEWIWQYL